MQRVTIDSGPTASIVKPASEKPVDQWISTRTDKKGEFVFENFLPGELLRIEIAPSFFPNKDLYRLRKFFFLSSGSKLLEQRERSSSRDAKEEEEESKHDDDNEEDDGSRFLVTLDEKGEIRRVKKKKEEERGKGGQRHQIEFRLRGYSVEGLLLDEQGQPLRDAQVLLEAGNEEKKSQNSESPQTSSSSSSSFFTSFVSILNHRNCFVERQLATEGKGGSHRHAGEEVLSPFFMKRITEREERRRRENKNEKSSLSCSTISSSTTGEFSFPILPFSPSSLRSLYIKPYQRLLLRQSSSSLGGDPAGDKQEQEEEREVVFNPVEMDLERDLLKAKRRGEEGRENVLHFPSVRVKLPSIQLAAFSIVGKVATVDPEASTSEQRKKRKALPLHAGETGGESREETGVEGARVFLRIVDKRSGVEEREEEFLTNEKGEYAVKSLPLRRKDDRQEEDEREIVLSAKKEHYTFSSIRLSFPSWRSRSFLPAIEVTSLSVCGRVVASPGSPSDAVSDLEVYVHPMLETGGRAAGGGGGTEGRRPEEKKTRTDEKGQFCFFLSPSTTYVLWTSFRHSSSSRMYRRTSLRRQERDGEEEEGDPVNIAHVVRKEGSRRVLRFAMEELQGGVTIPPSVSSSSSSSLKGEREEDLNVPVFVKFQVRGYSLPVQANASFSAHFLPLLSQRQDHPDNTQKGEESEITSSSSSPSISFFLPKGPFPICLPSFYKQYSLRFPSYLKVSSSSPSSSSPLHVMDIATLYNGSSSPSLDLTVTERRETIEIFLFSFLKNKHSQVEKEEEREQAILSKLRKRSFEVQLLSLSPREISKEKDEEEEEERSKKMRDEDGRDLQDSHEEREEEKMKKRRREDERRPQLVGGESHCHFSREVVEADALHLLNAGKTGQRHIREKEEENKVLVHQCSVWIPISYASSSLLIRVISPSSSLLGAGTENEGGEAYEGEILFLPNSSSDVQLNKDLSLLSPRSPSSSVSPSRYFYLLPSSSMTVHSDSTDYRSLEPNRDEEEIKNKIDQEEEEKKNRDKSTRTEELQNRGDLSLSAPPTLLRIKAERQCVFRGKIEPPLENVKISFIESSSSPSSPGSKMEKKEKDSIFPSSFYTKDVFSDKTGRFVSDVFRCRDSPFVEEEKGEGEKKKDVSKMRYEDLVKGVSIEAVYQGYSFMREDLRNRVERHDRQTERKDTDMILLKAIKEPTVTVRVVLSPSKRQNVSQGETEEGEEKGLKGVLISCSSLNDSSLPAAKLLTNSDGSAVFTPKKYLLSSSSSSSQSHSSANAKEEQKSKSRAKKSVIVLRMKPLLKGYEFSPSFHTVEIPQEEAEGRGGEEAESERKKEKKVLDKVITFTARKTLFDCAGYVYPLGVEKGEKWSQEDRSSSSSLT
ncbi:nodal modulator, partial [Cystoisospora suis]